MGPSGFPCTCFPGSESEVTNFSDDAFQEETRSSGVEDGSSRVDWSSVCVCVGGWVRLPCRMDYNVESTRLVDRKGW